MGTRCKLANPTSRKILEVHYVAMTDGLVRPACGGRGKNAGSTYTITDDEVTCPSCLRKAGER